jgi:hypothetical protein
MSLTKSYDQEIIDRNEIWANSIKNYQAEKKNLQWGKNKMPEIVSYKIIKERDCLFNPVTQCYKNTDTDIELRIKDKNKLYETIAKNYDRNLCYEQTYNLINRQDRFKVFKNHKDYPAYKSDPIRPKLEKKRIEHNILSNYSLDKHNFCKPEDRPFIKENPDKDKKKINVNLFREFDIISNKYKVSDKEKSVADKSISEYEAAKKFWKTHDYNLVTGNYYDKDKQINLKNKPDKQDTCKKHFTTEE